MPSDFILSRENEKELKEYLNQIIDIGIKFKLKENFKEKTISDELKQKRVKDLQTVFTTTTSCVLNSIATAKMPAIHGMIGWYNYNRDKKIDYYPLLFKEKREST